MMKAAKIIGVENLTLLVMVLSLIFLSSACVTTKTVGNFPVYGIVVDETNGKPLEGAAVFLHYFAVSNMNEDEKYTDPVFTDHEGKFYIEPQQIRLWGGYGPLTGYIKEYPDILYKKDGYCDNGKAFMRPTARTYRNMRLPLKPDTGNGCK